MENQRINQLLRFVEMDESDVFSRYALALEYRSLQAFDKAFQNFEYLVVNFPEYLPTYFVYGELLSQNGFVNQALEVLKKGETLAQNNKDFKTLNEIRFLIEELED